MEKTVVRETDLRSKKRLSFEESQQAEGETTIFDQLSRGYKVAFVVCGHCFLLEPVEPEDKCQSPEL